jgi:hypothetical protein
MVARLCTAATAFPPDLVLQAFLGTVAASDLRGNVGNLWLEHFGNLSKSFGVFSSVFSVLPFSFNP